MMQQYYDIKEQYPDSILFFRLGDFYEMFGDDATVASKVLEIALTSREAGLQGRIPMCGVPHHAAESYLEKLVNAGYRVALCEQLEDPRQAKGVVKRDVVRLITPGTFIEGKLKDSENQFLVSLGFRDRSWGLASLDMSTGEFMTVSTNSTVKVRDELIRLQPKEVVVTSDLCIMDDLSKLTRDLGAVITEFRPKQASLASASQLLLNHFAVSSLTPFGLINTAEILAAAIALDYVQDTQRSVLTLINRVRSYELEKFLQLDGHSRQNLELTETIREGKKTGSLL